ncbi:hypothetical protein [Ralstonia phage phiITL-1]|uniref:Uncharacterized protein n=1 Tax=Ralstonia phage phiITL-1 TaxID=1597967 RepID=A0A0U1ZGY3_9CAUD|nr:tail fiber assembly protein [Ralstonia phage phiITL-1]AJT60792.1 hypothetical protein [Ralstonia phage phiITL-1]
MLQLNGIADVIAKADDNFLDIEELLYVIMTMYPELVPGKDYVLSRMIDPNEAKQITDAKIAEWNSTSVAQPSIDFLRGVWFAGVKDSYVAWHKATEVRQWRDRELQRADAQVFILEDRGETLKATEWRAYRQALRDLPDQIGFPLKVTLPVAPA